MTKLVVIAIISVFLCVNCLKLEEKFSWVNVEFNWQSEIDLQKALSTKEYIPEHNVIVGLEKWKDKLFVTIPR